MEEIVVDNNSLLQLLECPVCLLYATSPIHQCKNGHLICHHCYPFLFTCPTCRGSLFKERNRAMEKVAELVKFPCNFSSFGCPRKILLTEKNAHEYDCMYMQLACPFKDSCNWNGCIPEVMAHLKDDHEVTPQKLSKDGWLHYIVSINNRFQDLVLIFQWDTNLFRFVIKKLQVSDSEDEFQYIAHIQCVGMESCAKRYAYIIRLCDQDCILMYKYESLVTSYLKDLNILIKDEDLLMFDQDDVQPYCKDLHFILQLSTIG